MQLPDVRSPRWNRAVLIALVAALCLAAGAAAAGSDKSPVVVRVPAEARARVAAAEVRPTQALDYGSFQWLEVRAADLVRLDAQGVPYVLVPDARQVRVPGFRFDPLVEGEPRIPANLRADASRPGFRLIQLTGPPLDAWLSRLAGAGARVLQYYPHNTYLVWATPAASAAAAGLGFVRWQGAFHPAYKINADLRGRTGTIANVDVMFFDDGDRGGTLDALSRLGAEVLRIYPSQPDKAFYDAILRLDAKAVEAVAALDNVLWLGFQSPRPILNDEMSDQIVAGNHPGGVPVTGYQSHLASLGVDGTGVVWAVVDTGVDYDHPDLGGHIAGGYSFPGIPAGCDPGTTPGADCSSGGHGTHVAGIIGGNAAVGFADVNGFLYGLGVAPKYSIFAMNSISAPSWPPAGGWQEHSKRAVLGGAIGGNNSWQTLEGVAHGYQASERTHDLMVRDGNFDTAAVAEPFIEVFAAGNAGPGPFSLTGPSEAKNLIVTASSVNFRVGGIDDISSFSSRGPAVDGRWAPTIAAPGEAVASSRNDLGGSCSDPIPGTNNFYAFCSGTSMASPHAAGAVVLFTEWWRGFHAGANPSPAMAKALLVNGAVDMGTADIPNANEGWGRVDVTNIITPAAPAEYWDQTRLFAATGETFHVTLGVPNPALPVKITLAWSDAAGAAGANPALVNNLDLTVVDGAGTYRGNRGGHSVDAADGAGNQPYQPVLTWQAVGAGGTYTVEVASDAAFAGIVETASGLTATTYTLTGTLNSNTIYYWRVRAGNACGTGGFSAPRSFTTLPAPGDCGAGFTAVPVFTDRFREWRSGMGAQRPGRQLGPFGRGTHGGASSFHANNPGTDSDQVLVTPALTLPERNPPPGPEVLALPVHREPCRRLLRRRGAGDLHEWWQLLDPARGATVHRSLRRTGLHLLLQSAQRRQRLVRGPPGLEAVRRGPLRFRGPDGPAPLPPGDGLRRVARGVVRGRPDRSGLRQPDLQRRIRERRHLALVLRHSVATAWIPGLERIFREGGQKC